MYCLTIGYPLGSEIVNNRQICQVSVNSRIMQLQPMEYHIWGSFLLGAYIEDVEKTLSGQELLVLAPTINKLVENGMLIGFPDHDFSEMKSLIFMRLGVGDGFNSTTGTYRVLFKDHVSLNAFEYDVWRQADGSLTYKEIEQRMTYKYNNHVSKVKETIFRLCRMGLLIAINRK